MITISELDGPQEQAAAETLLQLYGQLAALTPYGRQRVYARWEHLKLILPGDSKRWEKELKRVTR